MMAQRLSGVGPWVAAASTAVGNGSLRRMRHSSSSSCITRIAPVGVPPAALHVCQQRQNHGGVPWAERKLFNDPELGPTVPQKDGPTPPYGAKREYRPRYRPQDVVMPIRMGEEAPVDGEEPDELFPTSTSSIDIDRVLEDARRPVKLGTVPSERSVADCYQFCLAYCKENDLLHCRPVDGFAQEQLPEEKVPLYGHQERKTTFGSASAPASDLLLNGSNDSGATATEDSSNTAKSNHSLLDPSAAKASASSSELSRLRAEHLYELLEQIPLPSPVYGALSVKGKYLLQSTILSDLTHCFPRLRSRHARGVLHNVCGLLSTVEVAQRIGMAEFCGVVVDLSLWREKNFLDVRKRHVWAKIDQNEEKVRTGNISGERLRDFEREKKALKGVLKNLPAEIDELLPRVTWMANHIYAYIAFVELAEGRTVAKNMIRRLFCPSFSHPRPQDLGQHRQQAFQDRIAARWGSSGHMYTSESLKDPFVFSQEISREYTAVPPQPTETETQSGSETSSATNNTSSSSQQERKAEKYRVPAILTLSVQPRNALREMQFLLNYAPDVPPHLKGKALDFESEYKSLLDTDAVVQGVTKVYRQEQDALKAVHGRLFVGNETVGLGMGEDDAHAMQNAAKHMLMNYYFRKYPPIPAEPTVDYASTSETDGSDEWEETFNSTQAKEKTTTVDKQPQEQQQQEQEQVQPEHGCSCP